MSIKDFQDNRAADKAKEEYEKEQTEQALSKSEKQKKNSNKKKGRPIAASSDRGFGAKIKNTDDNQ